MRIAIVNDVPLAVKAVTRVIEEGSEHQVAWIARDGREAVAHCLEDRPDLILMDLIMPDMNGKKLADESRLLRPELKILFTTGYTSNAVVHGGVLDPGVNFLGKPFTLEQLATKIRAVLDA